MIANDGNFNDFTKDTPNTEKIEMALVKFSKETYV